MDNDTNKINLDSLADSLNIKKENEVAQETIVDKNLTAPETKIKETMTEPKASPLNSGPEDIFSDTEIEKPAVLQAKVPNSDILEEEEESGGSKKKLILLIVVLLGLLGVLAGAFFGYSYFIKGGKIDFLNKEVPSELNIEPVPVVNGTQENTNININQTPQVVVSNNLGDKNSTPINPETNKTEAVDSDSDGIPDQEEIIRGMNINSNDSDSDGLYDREEVMVYNTDPINPDTDGDGFLDGDEVNGGYNPKGAGKLYDINGLR